MQNTVRVLEVGGSHVTAGSVEVSAHRIVDRQRHPLDPAQDALTIIGALADAAKRLLPMPADRWAVAMPGPFDYVHGVSLHEGVSKFDQLHGVNLREALAEAIPARPESFTFVNDADAFLLGEWVDGAATGTDRSVAITLGTGIGSSWLADGAVVSTGPDVPPDGEIHFCDVDGVNIEDLVSDRALVRGYLARTGVTVDGMRGLATLARGGDTDAREVVATAFGVLGRLLTEWLDRFGAEVVVVGGSMTGAWDLIEPALHLPVPARPVADTERSALLGAAHAGQ
ncbi:ROK family protein [Dactylosporangium vinaceum]|uniref:ROK family protein n=1 Tax=Dactylosporangium vinaceum TaxID=53362 RepID=A0ABV5M1V0_9ACTN|nr:ROK family protein [Dactylosporangium vinaceum]UAB99263.1 ROK family protein [Dactylosporangium vinaceum]